MVVNSQIWRDCTYAQLPIPRDTSRPFGGLHLPKSLFAPPAVAATIARRCAIAPGQIDPAFMRTIIPANLQQNLGELKQCSWPTYPPTQMRDLLTWSTTLHKRILMHAKALAANITKTLSSRIMPALFNSSSPTEHLNFTRNTQRLQGKPYPIICLRHKLLPEPVCPNIVKGWSCIAQVKIGLQLRVSPHYTATFVRFQLTLS